MIRRSFRLGGQLLLGIGRTKRHFPGSTQDINRRLVFAVIASACWSAFQFGYNIEVMNAPQDVMSHWLQQDALSKTNFTADALEDPKVLSVWSIIVSIYCVGGMVGGLYTGFIAERFGRKGGLLLSNIIAMVAAVSMGTAKMANSAALLVFGRLIIGINNGLNAGLAPMYLAEISPVSLRGSIGAVCQLVTAISMLLSQILGQHNILGNDNGWPILLSIIAVPCALQYLMLPCCPESPKYLLFNRKEELEAQRALTWLRGNISVYSEMDDMKQEFEDNKINETLKFDELISDPYLRQPLIIAIVVMLAQQLSGINAIMLYSTEIFQNAGLPEVQSRHSTIGMGVVNVIMTFLSFLLVDKGGKKMWLLVGILGMMLCNVALTVSMALTANNPWVTWLCVVVIILFVVMYALGPGSIPWFLVTELFHQSARPAATAVAVTVNWTANFVVGLTFLPLAALLGGYVFMIFAVLQLIFLIYILLKLPETKNMTTEEISDMFRPQR